MASSPTSRCSNQTTRYLHHAPRNARGFCPTRRYDMNEHARSDPSGEGRDGRCGRAPAVGRERACRPRRAARSARRHGASPRGEAPAPEARRARGARAYGAAEARRRARRNLGVGAVVRRLYGRAAPGGALQGHRRRRHRRGRPLCLRREPRFAHLPVLADRGRAERNAGRLQMHEDLLGPARRRRAWPPRGRACRSRQDRPARRAQAGQCLSLLRQQGPDRHATRGAGGRALLQGGRGRGRQPHFGRRRRRPCLHHRGRRRRLRHLGGALRHRLRLRPGQGHSRLDLRAARGRDA